MKHFQTVWITPQPYHSHFFCWLLPIWPKLDVWAENVAYCLCRLVWRYTRTKLYFFWPYMILSMIWNTFELSASQISRATAILVVDSCQFGPSWMFELKMELMASVDLVGGTTEKSCLFSDLILYYQWYEILLSCLHHTTAVPQSFLLLIAANLALAGCLSWKWSLWPVPAWLAVQWSKSVFFLTLYDSINDMKYWLTVCITPQPCHSHLCCWLLPIWP